MAADKEKRKKIEKEVSDLVLWLLHAKCAPGER